MWKPNFLKRALLRKQVETGEMNAQRFVRVACALAREERIVQMHPAATGLRGAVHERYGWRWMGNAQWRERVKCLLAEKHAPLRGIEFHEPDNFGDWSFSAISTAAIPRVAMLTLEEAL